MDDTPWEGENMWQNVCIHVWGRRIPPPGGLLNRDEKWVKKVTWRTFWWHFTIQLWLALIKRRLTCFLYRQKNRPDSGKIGLLYFKEWICWSVMRKTLYEYTSKWDIGRSFSFLNSRCFKERNRKPFFGLFSVITIP